ncbi:MAG TPA: hypothetical protein VMN03_04255 [Burkholderiales bacterium]|nr:hypothetical protein [Burkholderiales bacterium]
MRLIEELERRLVKEASPFQAQLLREDIRRLGALRELARTAGDTAACRDAAMRLGWTQGDLRTQELRVPLEAVADALFEYEAGARTGAQEERIIVAWTALHRARMERLVGCLATPVPRPGDMP